MKKKTLERDKHQTKMEIQMKKIRVHVRWSETKKS